jgi:hypothetical protein
MSKWNRWDEPSEADDLVYKKTREGITTVYCWACDEDPTGCEACSGLGVIGVSEIAKDCISKDGQ